MKCCGYPMLARKNYNGDSIWWCTSCGKKRPRMEAQREKGMVDMLDKEVKEEEI